MADSSKPGSRGAASRGIDRGNVLAVTEQELRQLLQDVLFTRHYGFVLNRIGDGECTLDVPFDEKFTRPGGVIAGQVFMTTADVAMWFAVKTKLGLHDPSVTASMTTAFLRSAVQESFSCAATVLKLGKRQVYGVAECRNQADKVLSHHVITYARL
jgi:uncharacterized protein (TIGR00369 family)